MQVLHNRGYLQVSLFTHFRNYATGGLFSALIGVASFPILTRSLSVEDYGLLGLVISSLTLFVAFGKLGVQHAIVRFYAQVKNNNSPYSENEFFTTTLTLAFLLGCLTMGVWLLTGLKLLPSFIPSQKLPGLFAIGTLYIVLRMLGSSMCNVLSAQQHSQPVMMSVVVRRSVHLLMILLFLLTDLVSATAVVFSFVLSELISLVYVARHYRVKTGHHGKKRSGFSIANFNISLSKTLFTFGLPLMLLESNGLLMRLSDRYIIQYLMDDNALGQYAASYNFSLYIEVIITSALVTAIRPMYTEIWESKGEEHVAGFLAKGLNLYLMLGIPFVALFSLTAPHVINILASPKYEAGTVIVPWVTAAILFDGAIVFLAAGLYIHRKTRNLLFWGGAALLANIVLNFLVIPRFGILGASVVTLITFMVYALGIASSSRCLLSFPVSLAKPSIMALASIIVWLMLNRMPVSSDILAIAAKGSCGLLILGMVAFLLDASVREFLHLGLCRFMPGRFASPGTGKGHPIATRSAK